MATMNTPQLFQAGRPAIIAALHLPPLPASGHPTAQPVEKIIAISLSNAQKAVKAGVPALYIQDLGDFPWAPEPQPHTVSVMSVVGAAIRQEFPGLALGVCMMSHAPKETLAIAQAIEAQFVRLKVYAGAMVKAEGLVEGCAYEAIQYRSQIGADQIQILADVYDRSGQPLAPLPLVEAARQAAVFGRADGLILTGKSFDESLSMLGDVKNANFNAPLLLGGGAKPGNIAKALQVADGAIVSSAFKSASGWTREAMLAEWELPRIQSFMEAVNHSRS